MSTEIFVEQYDDYEIIGGEKFIAPSPDCGRVNVTANLVIIIGGYARTNKLGVAIADNFDVHKSKIFSAGISNLKE